MKQLLLLALFLTTSVGGYAQNLYDNYELSNSEPRSNYQGLTSDDYDRLLAIKLNAANREEKRVASLILNTINIYNQAKKYPTYLYNGYYNVTLTNHSDFCEEAKVYVYRDKISTLEITSGPNTGFKPPLSFSSEINKAKSLIKIEGLQNIYFHAYFIESLYSE